MESKGKSLLIISCSKRKIPGCNGRALSVYDGPVFRSIRKYLSENQQDHSFQIIILSAKYGFISADHPIEGYDRRINKQISMHEHDCLRRQFRELTKNGNYSDVFINLGKDYYNSFPELTQIIEQRLTGNIHIAEGKIGQRLHQMKSWLYRAEQSRA